MRSDDELEGLRRAWDEVEAPQPVVDPAETDEAERAALAWMRASWDRVEPAAPARSPAPVARWPWIAAAAAAGLAGLWFATAPIQEGPRGTASSSEQAIARPEPGVDRGTPEAPPTAPEQVELASITSDRMELRSGPVRLILLTPSAGPAAARGDDG